MKILVICEYLLGLEWARKCWSARGMSGHESAGLLKGMFYPSFAGTLTMFE
jgi:hypothetical protein